MSHLKRRTFIRNSVIAGIGASITPDILKATSKNTLIGKGKKNKKVSVAGAGITGLCCGYELMKKGHHVTILEASGRYGGHVFTGRDGINNTGRLKGQDVVLLLRK